MIPAHLQCVYLSSILKPVSAVKNNCDFIKSKHEQEGKKGAVKRILWSDKHSPCCHGSRRFVLPGSGESPQAWNHWASSRTSLRCACTDICSPVYDSSWWFVGCCPPCSHSGRYSLAQCGRTTNREREGGGRNKIRKLFLFCSLCQHRQETERSQRVGIRTGSW